MRKGKRIVYRVRLDRHGWWVLVLKGTALATNVRKTHAVDFGRRLARHAWQKDGCLAQLVVHGRNGRVQFENTYGRDPRRRLG